MKLAIKLNKKTWMQSHMKIGCKTYPSCFVTDYGILNFSITNLLPFSVE